MTVMTVRSQQRSQPVAVALAFASILIILQLGDFIGSSIFTPSHLQSLFFQKNGKFLQSRGVWAAGEFPGGEETKVW